MKLEHEDTRIWDGIHSYVYIPILILCMIMMIWLATLAKRALIIYICVMMCILVVVTIAFQRTELKGRNVNKQEMKNIGEKAIANIVEAGEYRSGGRPRRTIRYIVILHDNKLTRIQYIKENQAFSMLKLLLNPYPIKEKVMIPIDIYIYKNKIYADLESVDFTKVKGYDEAKKAVEQIWNN